MTHSVRLLVGWLVGWLVHLLVGQSVSWLVDQLVGRLVSWSVTLCFFCFSLSLYVILIHYKLFLVFWSFGLLVFWSFDLNNRTRL